MSPDYAVNDASGCSSRLQRVLTANPFVVQQCLNRQRLGRSIRIAAYCVCDPLLLRGREIAYPLIDGLDPFLEKLTHRPLLDCLILCTQSTVSRDLRPLPASRIRSHNRCPKEHSGQLDVDGGPCLAVHRRCVRSTQQVPGQPIRQQTLGRHTGWRKEDIEAIPPNSVGSGEQKVGPHIARRLDRLDVVGILQEFRAAGSYGTAPCQ